MTPQKLLIWLVILISLGLAIVVGVHSADMDFETVLMLGAVLLTIWTLFGGNYWWIIFPAAVGFGGFFYYGFKIYFHEITLFICLLPLIPAVLFKQIDWHSHRRPLPWGFHLLAIYLIAHGIYGLSRDFTGWGNIFREYFNSWWPLIFIYAFHRFGSRRHLVPMLVVLFAALFLRMLIELYTYFWPDFDYIPGLNYVPAQGAASLRFSASALMILAVALLLCSRGLVRAIFYRFIALNGFVICLLSGGRSYFIALCFLPFMWLALYRRWILLVLIVFGFATVIGFVNYNPGSLEALPSSVQRSLSVVILKPDILEIQREQSESNRWHYTLVDKSFERLLESPITFMFGHPIESFATNVTARFITKDEEFNVMVDLAVRSGRYESGLASILGVYGVTGFILYAGLFYYCLKDLFPYLWRHRVRSLTDAICLIAVSKIFVWVVMSWVNGGVPSLELMWCFMARILWQDENLPRESPESVSEGKSTVAVSESSGPEWTEGDGTETVSHTET